MSIAVNIERNRLATLFYLLTRDSMPWGELHRKIDKVRKSDEHDFTSGAGFALAEAAVIRLLGEEPTVEVERLAPVRATPSQLRAVFIRERFTCHALTVHERSPQQDLPQGVLDRIEFAEGSIVTLYASGKAVVQGTGPLGVVRELARESGWSVSS